MCEKVARKCEGSAKSTSVLVAARNDDAKRVGVVGKIDAAQRQAYFIRLRHVHERNFNAALLAQLMKHREYCALVFRPQAFVINANMHRTPTINEALPARRFAED